MKTFVLDAPYMNLLHDAGKSITFS